MRLSPFFGDLGSTGRARGWGDGAGTGWPILSRAPDRFRATADDGASPNGYDLGHTAQHTSRAWGNLMGDVAPGAGLARRDFLRIGGMLAAGFSTMPLL